VIPGVFGRTCCLILRGISALKVEVVFSFEMSAKSHLTDIKLCENYKSHPENLKFVIGYHTHFKGKEF
jgi:hypothetical protein